MWKNGNFGSLNLVDKFIYLKAKQATGKQKKQYFASFWYIHNR